MSRGSEVDTVDRVTTRSAHERCTLYSAMSERKRGELVQRWLPTDSGTIS